jgi:uncharacterized membrane protein
MNETANEEALQGGIGQADQANMVKVCYWLYLASIVFGVLAIVSVMIAYIKRGDVQGTWLAGHYSWIIRTFWITAITGIIGFLLCVVGIGFVILFADWVYFVYRVIKGFIAFNDKKAIA